MPIIGGAPVTEGLAGILTGILEIAVVGAGGAAAVTLVILAATQQPLAAVDLGPSEGVAFIALISVLYVLGVVMDRLADTVLEAVSPKGVAIGLDERQYRIARLQLAQSPELFNRLEYIRSRLRVARGWTLNAILLAPAWTWYALVNVDRHQTASVISGLVFALALAAGCWMSWYELRDKERCQVELFHEHRSQILGLESTR